MAYRWFGDDERAVAISFGALGTPVGCVVGLMVGPNFITETWTSGQITKSEQTTGRHEVENYVFWHAVIDTVLCLPLIFLFVEKPKFFPSRAAKSMGRSEDQYSIMADLKLLRSKRSFLFFVLNFALVHGVYAALGATVNNVVRPFGYSAKESALFGGVCIISGLVASYFFSAFLDRAVDKTARMINILWVISIGSFLSFIVMLFLLKPDRPVVVALAIGLAGIFLIPIMPIGYYAAVELSKPVSEPMSSGLIMVFGMIAGVAFTYFVSIMCDSGTSVEEQKAAVVKCEIVFIFTLLLGCLLMFLVKPQPEEEEQ